MDGGIQMKRNSSQKAVHIMVCIMISLYPLVLRRIDLGGLQIQSLLFFVVAMGVLLCCFLLIQRKEWVFRDQYHRVDLAIMALAGYEFLRIIGKIFFADGESSVSYDWEVLILSMASVYLLCSVNAVFDRKYFDLPVFAGLIVFGGLLYHYLCGSGMDALLDVMLEDSYAAASYVLLICTISLYQYCKCKDKMRSCFYAGVSLIGYFVLFLNHNIVSIWLMALVFIAFPVWFRPTAEWIKRDMQLFFLYLFLLSNMSLLTGYTNLIRAEVSFSLEHSVYLDLLLAAGGVWFFRSWEKLPEEIELDRLVLRKMKRGYQFLLRTMLIVFAGILIGGGYWGSLPEEGMAMPTVRETAALLAEEIQSGKGFLFTAIAEQGVSGGLLLLILCSMLAGRLWKNYSYDKPDTGIMILLSFLFLIQLLFWKASINTLPVYFVYVVFAITYKEEREKVISTKMKLEKEN